MTKLTASNLKEALWDTLTKVQSGEMQASQADSVAVQAREIIRTCNLQLRISSQAKRDVPTEVIDFGENK